MITYGNAPAPWTVSWSEESKYWVAPEPLLRGAMAIHQVAGRGGRPRFGKPHYNRQRKVMLEGRCDLCAEELKKYEPKYVMSQTDMVHLNIRTDICLEPMLHAKCVGICLEHCPALKDQARKGWLHIRRVLSHRKIPVPIGRDEMLAELGMVYHGPDVVGYMALQILAARDEPVEVWLRAAA